MRGLPHTSTHGRQRDSSTGGQCMCASLICSNICIILLLQGNLELRASTIEEDSKYQFFSKYNHLHHSFLQTGCFISHALHDNKGHMLYRAWSMHASGYKHWLTTPFLVWIDHTQIIALNKEHLQTRTYILYKFYWVMCNDMKHEWKSTVKKSRDVLFEELPILFQNMILLKSRKNPRQTFWP